MKIRQIIHLPLLIQSISGRRALARRWNDRIRAENDHIQPARRGVIDPFGREGADGVQGGEIELLGINELVAGTFAHVVDIFDEEGVGGAVVG